VVSKHSCDLVMGRADIQTDRMIEGVIVLQQCILSMIIFRNSHFTHNIASYFDFFVTLLVVAGSKNRQSSV